jgi:sphingolipid C9-methyltransferase
LLGLLFFVPWWVARQVYGGFYTTIFFAIFTTIPILITYWFVSSRISPRRNEKVKLPGKPVESYISFRKEEDRERYYGRNKIPIWDFHEKYFDEEIDVKGDMLDTLEQRHDWANFKFVYGAFKHVFVGFGPEMLWHSRSQDEEQVRDHYDRGDDFYSWFLGPRMVYTSGIISDPSREETLEELQDNKMAIVCEKLGLQPGDTLLDIGCGWGTLAKYASVNYGAHATGVTLGKNQTIWGNNGFRKAGIPEEQSRILCMDYRDIPVPAGGFKKISCLEMAEHVGVRYFGKFLSQVHDMLDDDGVFFLQIVGFRKSWQYEDLLWGLFMNKYIFPGADASAPLDFVVGKLEGTGFEIKHIDTVGVHYSATIWRWYRNWMANADKVQAKYGVRWFRIWEYFLASAVISSRQGSATCYQITMVKNINSTHRVEGVKTHYGLEGALRAGRAHLLDKQSGSGVSALGDSVKQALRSDD